MIVLYVFTIFWIMIQLYLLKIESPISWIFLVGDIILGLSLLFISWVDEIMKERKREK